ncbi:GNAT family N-acetyltransferase [Glaciihabitans sp. dw_435]|uniref:GNAT family N-acetyltransferase n=1 Tax=Glaciihabitans sp. dw_435 TaxID=2720081 RepID=UPI001BD505FC|nr:GNAT family N-acetyltransferase [Glaciihabitans sp. dw_435]
MPEYRIDHVSYDDPRAAEMREAMDVELFALYATPEQPVMDDATLAALEIDPATMVSTLLVIGPDGAVVGHAALRHLDDEWEMKRVVVDSAHRGAGLAKRLVAQIEADARGMGARRLILHTGGLQPAAEALYSGLGYEPIPVYEPYASVMPASKCFAKTLG